MKSFSFAIFLSVFGIFSIIIRAQDGEISSGAIIRTDTAQKEIHLIFTGHHFADGGQTIREILKKHKVKASFFFTGDFYRNPDFSSIIKGLKKDGHYLGGHSDNHIMYVSPESTKSTIVTREEFRIDLKNNYAAMKRFGINRRDAYIYLSPFERYNQETADWVKAEGLTLINFTPGTLSNEDYSIPSMGNGYVNSDKIYESIIKYEQGSEVGLNGFILLTHIGTVPERTDKFYFKLDKLISGLEAKGYKFTKLHFNIPAVRK